MFPPMHWHSGHPNPRQMCTERGGKVCHYWVRIQFLVCLQMCTRINPSWAVKSSVTLSQPRIDGNARRSIGERTEWDTTTAESPRLTSTAGGWLAGCPLIVLLVVVIIVGLQSGLHNRKSERGARSQWKCYVAAARRQQRQRCVHWESVTLSLDGQTRQPDCLEHNTVDKRRRTRY